MAEGQTLQQFPDPRSRVPKQDGKPVEATNNQLLSRISTQLDMILWALGGPEIANVNKTGYMLRAAAAQQAESKLVVPQVGVKLPADGGHV